MDHILRSSSERLRNFNFPRLQSTPFYEPEIRLGGNWTGTKLSFGKQNDFQPNLHEINQNVISKEYDGAFPNLGGVESAPSPSPASTSSSPFLPIVFGSSRDPMGGTSSWVTPPLRSLSSLPLASRLKLDRLVSEFPFVSLTILEDIFFHYSESLEQSREAVILIYGQNEEKKGAERGARGGRGERGGERGGRGRGGLRGPNAPKPSSKPSPSPSPSSSSSSSSSSLSDQEALSLRSELAYLTESRCVFFSNFTFTSLVLSLFFCHSFFLYKYVNTTLGCFVCEGRLLRMLKAMLMQQRSSPIKVLLPLLHFHLVFTILWQESNTMTWLRKFGKNYLGLFQSKGIPWY